LIRKKTREILEGAAWQGLFSSLTTPLRYCGGGGARVTHHDKLVEPFAAAFFDLRLVFIEAQSLGREREARDLRRQRLHDAINLGELVEAFLQHVHYQQ